MRVLMFQPQFEQPILDGRKGSTIRKTARCKEGDVLSLRLWTGKPYRSKQHCMMQVACQAIADVRIYSDRERDAVVEREGFGSWEAMRDWFQTAQGLPFEGEMIR